MSDFLLDTPEEREAFEALERRQREQRRTLPDVSWAGPLIRAEKNLREARELLERGQRDQADQLLEAAWLDIARARVLAAAKR